MRLPDWEIDGWCLEDGEQIHHEAPDTFWLPPLAQRTALQSGDLAKLIFRIAVQGHEPVSVERMWVIVRSAILGGYVGMLDNEPDAIAENDELWLGTELFFEYRHIIQTGSGNEKTRHLASEPVPIPWTKANSI